MNVSYAVLNLSKARAAIAKLNKELENNKQIINQFMNELEKWFDTQRDGVPTVVKCDGQYLLIYRGHSGHIEITEADIVNA